MHNWIECILFKKWNQFLNGLVIIWAQNHYNLFFSWYLRMHRTCVQEKVWVKVKYPYYCIRNQTQSFVYSDLVTTQIFNTSILSCGWVSYKFPRAPWKLTFYLAESVVPGSVCELQNTTKEPLGSFYYKFGFGLSSNTTWHIRIECKGWAASNPQQDKFL